MKRAAIWLTQSTIKLSFTREYEEYSLSPRLPCYLQCFVPAEYKREPAPLTTNAEVWVVGIDALGDKLVVSNPPRMSPGKPKRISISHPRPCLAVKLLFSSFEIRPTFVLSGAI